MKLAIMQPYLFPYIGYYQLLRAADKFIVLDDVNFIKKGWINRNYILINGQRSLFTVPLQNASQNRLIKDIEVVSDSEWKEKFLKSIAFSYKKAPFFAETYDLIEKVVRSGETYISKMIVFSFQLLKEALELKTAIVPTSAIYNNSGLKAQNKILDICKQENADQYINPIGGTELYDRQFFRENGIELFFLRTQPITYCQFNEEFEPYLSIIDVLMFNGFAKSQELLSKFTLE
jgi:hypothetical protein